MRSLISPPRDPSTSHPRNNKSIRLLKLRAPNSKEKLIVHSKKEDEPATPGFADLKSYGSKRSEQSQRQIQLVAEIDANPEDILKNNENIQQSPIQSQRSLKKKRKDDSPICDFQPKNSLKSFDSKKLTKLKSLSEHKVRFEDNKDNDSQRSNSADNKSVKSIMKQELKYSQFRKMQTQGDVESRKKVQFSNNK
ncbi:unnamed protein product (macronuclear) [Paramecium tetraurelia]|uniref:Uncharacterized protein n=1 Tax=Paramecium tetraurelia TaxID=5888 RepID=A0DDD9_PARTE|nr:uncharacterized protein GSPATT00015915001 [Paramecium tetraurelia]CAK81056.1 unnamed protein product [Paramecium tetraurelia]|eukprot:XP_001448453.1 hypothetical protein (macronuclear) [Paramecium tetraurelia strain d4-2]